MELKTKRLKGEEGFVLVVAILFMLVLTLIGVGAVNTTTYENGISGNLRVSKEAFYIAEAGLHEFMGRFRPGVTGKITDTNLSNPNLNWRLFLAPNTQRAAAVGYKSGDGNHFFIQSLQNQMDYGVEIRHKADDAGKNVVTKAGIPLYIAKSQGFTVQRGNKVIEAEIIKRPTIEPPAALYSKMPVLARGTSTYISGMDHCGSTNMPGIITTSTFKQEGLPGINGNPDVVTNSSEKRYLQEIADYFHDVADFSYSFQADQILSGYSDKWGSPVDSAIDTAPLTYDGPMKTVYFDMQGDKTLLLQGQAHGAGLLIVNGNLRITGGFSWYGAIVVTGSLLFEGGAEKNISGGILVGETATLATDVAGDSHILYCSEAINKLNMFQLRMVQWREILGKPS